MSKKKKGKVIRLSEFAFDHISAQRTEGESLRELVDRMILDYADVMLRLSEFERARPMFVLRDHIFATRKEARGAAVLHSVNNESPYEEPIRVRVMD